MPSGVDSILTMRWAKNKALKKRQGGHGMKILDNRLNPPRHPGLILACVCACTVLVVGLVAATNLAVPILASSSLHPSSSELLWIVDIYVILFACLVIPGGAAGDRFGRKGILIAGLVTFAVGASISAASVNVTSLLLGRAITGVGAALVLPNCVGVLVHATAPDRRVHGLAIWGMTTGLGGLWAISPEEPCWLPDHGGLCSGASCRSRFFSRYGRPLPFNEVSAALAG